MMLADIENFQVIKSFSGEAAEDIDLICHQVHGGTFARLRQASGSIFDQIPVPVVQLLLPQHS